MYLLIYLSIYLYVLSVSLFLRVFFVFLVDLNKDIALKEDKIRSLDNEKSALRQKLRQSELENVEKASSSNNQIEVLSLVS